MHGLIVTLFAKTASFRDPGTQLYHETLPLPTPTSIVGIAGAALGISFEKALCFMKSNNIMVGCNGRSEGKGKDLWNYFKIKSGDNTHAIVIRNFLYNLKVDLFFASKEKYAIEKLYNAFKNPVYAITLGNSDEIARIDSIEIVEILGTKSGKILSNIWLPGDYSRKMKFDWERVRNTKLNISIKPPIVKKLPIDFEYDSNGARKGSKYMDITFIADNHVLETEAELLVFGDKCAPVIGFE